MFGFGSKRTEQSTRANRPGFLGALVVAILNFILQTLVLLIAFISLSGSKDSGVTWVPLVAIVLGLLFVFAAVGFNVLLRYFLQIDSEPNTMPYPAKPSSNETANSLNKPSGLVSHA